MRKYEAIDLMKLHAMGSANGWNEFLTKCLDNLDINALAKCRYQIAAGMDDLAKAKLNTDEMNVWFLRLNKSLEDTAKKIIRRKHPMPNDNPLNHDYGTEFLDLKRKRDNELAEFLRKSAY